MHGNHDAEAGGEDEDTHVKFATLEIKEDFRGCLVEAGRSRAVAEVVGVHLASVVEEGEEEGQRESMAVGMGIKGVWTGGLFVLGVWGVGGGVL